MIVYHLRMVRLWTINIRMHSSRRFGVEREGMGTHDAPAWFSFRVFSNEILYENAVIHPSLCPNILLVVFDHPASLPTYVSIVDHR